MASNVKAATELMEETLNAISRDNETWRSYLHSVGRSYKYSFHDQLMIHAQNPEATACATKEQWDRLGRKLYNDAEGITLLEEHGKRTSLRYVYDVSDTIEPDDCRPIGLFVMKPEYRDPIRKRLEEVFTLSKDATMENAILLASLHLAGDYWKSNRSEILHTLRLDSFDGEDSQTIGNVFVALLATSIAYTLMTRLTTDPDRQVRISHFNHITRLHESDSIQLLGTAVSTSVSRLFKEVILGVREFKQERKKQPDPTEPEKTVTVPNDPVKPNPEPIISTSVPSSPDEKNTSIAESVETATNDHTSEEYHLHIQPIAQQTDCDPDSDATVHTHPESDSPVYIDPGTNMPGNVDPESDISEDIRQEDPTEPEPDPPSPKHVEEVPSHSGYVAILNSGIMRDDLERLDREYPILMEISDEEFCRILTHGTLTEQGKRHVKSYFEQEADADKRCEFLRAEFGNSGRSWVLPGNVGVFIDYGRTGITIWRYKDNQEVRYRWPEVTEHISSLISSGRYLSDDLSLHRDSEPVHSSAPARTRSEGRDIC